MLFLQIFRDDLDLVVDNNRGALFSLTESDKGAPGAILFLLVLLFESNDTTADVLSAVAAAGSLRCCCD